MLHPAQFDDVVQCEHQQTNACTSLFRKAESGSSAEPAAEGKKVKSIVSSCPEPTPKGRAVICPTDFPVVALLAYVTQGYQNI